MQKIRCQIMLDWKNYQFLNEFMVMHRGKNLSQAANLLIKDFIHQTSALKRIQQSIDQHETPPHPPQRREKMPSDAILLAITIISCVFGLIMVKVMNQQWFQRLDAKYSHEQKLAKLRKRGVKVSTPPPSSPMDWIEKLKGINPDVLHTLIDTVSGDEGLEVEGGDLTDILVNYATKNPDVVKGLLEGITSKTKTTESDIFEK